MKKRTIKYSWIHCRKWIATWTVLILIFSLISVSAGSEDDTGGAGSGNYTDLKIVTEKDDQSEESTKENLEVQEGLGDGTDNLETDIENLKNSAQESSNIDNQESPEEIQKLGLDTEKDTDSQENLEQNPEAEEIESCSADNLESAYKTPAQKKETEEKPECQRNSETNLKIKTSAEDEKDSSENLGTETEIKTEQCDELKNLEIVEVKTESEREVCNGITSVKSEGVESEATKEACSEENLADTSENTDLTDIDQTEVSVHDVKKSTRTGIKQKSQTDLSTESPSLSTVETEQSVLDTASLLGIKGLEPQIRAQSVQVAEAVKKPSKPASFLTGLLGTLLIGISIISRRR